MGSGHAVLTKFAQFYYGKGLGAVLENCQGQVKGNGSAEAHSGKA